MQRQFLQRLFLVLLLAARLVVGELAHAGAHDLHASEDVTRTAAAVDAEGCPDHVAPSPAPQAAAHGLHTPQHPAEPHQGRATSDEPADLAGSHATHDSECCDLTACECACVQTSALAAVPVDSVLSVQHAGAAPAAGLMLKRLFAPFRPPA